jgi:hypothetical protein
MEVTSLPKMFAIVNKNFVSTAVEGALLMAGESVDHDTLQDVAALSGSDNLPMEWDV